MDQNRKDIEELLLQLFIFDTGFRRQILSKIGNGLSAEKLGELKRTLEQALVWQKGVLAKKLGEDPELYDKILSEKSKVDREVLQSYYERIRAEDQKKIEIILLRIKQI